MPFRRFHRGHIPSQRRRLQEHCSEAKQNQRSTPPLFGRRDHFAPLLLRATIAQLQRVRQMHRGIQSGSTSRVSSRAILGIPRRYVVSVSGVAGCRVASTPQSRSRRASGLQFYHSAECRRRQTVLPSRIDTGAGTRRKADYVHEFIGHA